MGYVYILREKLKNPEPPEKENDPAHLIFAFLILLIVVVVALFYDTIGIALKAYLPG